MSANQEEAGIIAGAIVACILISILLCYFNIRSKRTTTVNHQLPGAMAQQPATIHLEYDDHVISAQNLQVLRSITDL